MSPPQRETSTPGFWTTFPTIIYHDAARPERTISNNQASTIARQLVAGLKRWGDRPGQEDVVCLHFNDIMYSVLFLGTIGAAVITPAYTPFELVHHFKTAQVKYLATEPEMLQSILAAAEECDILWSNILIFNVNGQDVPAGFRSWEILLDQGEQDWLRSDDLQISKTIEAVVLFSSGTTGLPKAAPLSHYNLIAEHTMACETVKRD